MGKGAILSWGDYNIYYIILLPPQLRNIVHFIFCSSYLLKQQSLCGTLKTNTKLLWQKLSWASYIKEGCTDLECYKVEKDKQDQKNKQCKQQQCMYIIIVRMTINQNPSNDPIMADSQKAAHF